MVSKENELLQRIRSRFDLKGSITNERRIWLTIKDRRLLEICSWMKDQGFIHLSAISVTDWIEEGKYEITYHLWSYKLNLLVTIKTKIDREDPVIPSVIDIWKENAQIHEREMHEMFGVKFKGNRDLAPLFLEDWNGPPPFRKDFNWREYVREECFSSENKRENAYYD
jgi:NADH-quinone oxidoreductase subunit C